MDQFSNLSANVAPFQSQAALPTPRLARAVGGLQKLVRDGPMTDISLPCGTMGSPINGLTSPSCYQHEASDDGGLTTDGSSSDYTFRRKKRKIKSKSSRSDKSSRHSNESASSHGGRKKKDGFSSKIHIPEFCGKKAHSSDVTGAFHQWARCITYYRDYYEDSYLMPLVVSSLTGDAYDVFDWILSLNPENTQNLTTLLQMLREHYCGSLTFREQRNTIENLCQKPQEVTIDFLIRVGTSVSNLGKDWRDEITEGELQSLQYEVSLNGVKEKIRHVLDSEIARSGQLTPNRCMRPSRSMKLMWPVTKGLMVRVPALLPVSRRLLAILQGTGLGFIKLQCLLQLLRRQRRMLIIRRKSTPRELNHLKKTIRDYTSPAIWRRLYQMTPCCK